MCDASRMQATDLLTDWGRRLTRARQDKDLSIGELARRVGMHKSHLARFERGEAGLGDESRMRVAAEVGQQVSNLFPYPDSTQDDECPSAASATAPGSSETPATAAAIRSPAPSAAAQGASGPTATRVTVEVPE